MLESTSAGLDAAVAWHLGDPLGEQRALLAGTACVDLSHFCVIKVSGPDRLPWLHLLLTQAVEHLAPMQSVHALILSATGHIEHDLKVVDDGESTWLIAEPGTAASLMAYLQSMVFMYRVEVADVSGGFAVVGALDVPDALSGTGTGSAGGEHLTWRAPAALAFADRTDDPYVPARPAPWPAALTIVPRERLRHVAFHAGMWAWEAARVAAAVPRLGFEIDHRTLPHEVGLIGSAVHRAKGCYRGQEAVARTLNLGRPPRRLVLLHLDGSSEALPGTGAPVLADDAREVGYIGTAVVHCDLGQIALAVVKRAVDPHARLTVQVDGADIAAAQQPVVVI